MFKLISTFALATLIAAPALADGMDYAPRRYYQPRYYLPPERHVIEVVRPPWSGNFIINGARFTALTGACFGWAAGDRIRLKAFARAAGQRGAATDTLEIRHQGEIETYGRA
jgi:hypothetical protein